jgi:hypothetical protein
MTIPEQNSDTESDVQDVHEENLTEVSGGAASPKLFSANTDELTNAGGQGGQGGHG